VYLQAMFPRTYMTPLVPANQAVAVANTLAGNNFMGCCGGTAIEKFILGKQMYIESQDKGVTQYAAQISNTWSTGAKPDFVTDKTPPTLAFLAQQLQAGEDVEVSLATPRLGHFLTLTGISYDDVTNKGQLSFVDPDGGGRGTAMILGLRNGVIRTDYLLGGVTADIVNAVAESPVPEPSTWLLLASGLGTLARWRRRKR
jgi:hypothetical protein